MTPLLGVEVWICRMHPHSLPRLHLLQPLVTVPVPTWWHGLHVTLERTLQKGLYLRVPSPDGELLELEVTYHSAETPKRRDGSFCLFRWRGSNNFGLPRLYTMYHD